MRKKRFLFITTLLMAVIMASVTLIPVMAEEVPDAEMTEEQNTSLKLWDTGDDVKAMQEKLIALGFLDDVADGSFGNNTLEAVKAFCEFFNLPDIEEVTPEMLSILEELATTVPTENNEDANAVKDESFMGTTLHIYADGTTTMNADSVTDEQVEAMKAIAATLTTAYDSQETKPEEPDSLWVLEIAEAFVNEEAGIKAEMSLNDLSEKAVASGEAIQLEDTEGNQIVIGTDGSITSNSGNIFAAKVDYDTGEHLGEAASRSIETVDWKKPGEIWFRATRLMQGADGEYVLPEGTIVSEQTIKGARQYLMTMYRATQTASTEEEATSTDVTEVPKQDSAQNANTPVQTPAPVATQPTSQTGTPSSQSSHTEPTRNTQTVDWQQYLPQAQEQANPTPAYVPEPAPAYVPASVPQTATHEHTWTPITTVVHHDAVTEQQPVQSVVHHDAVTHEEPIYENAPIYQTVTYTQCTVCGRRIGPGATQEELYAFSDHQFEDGGGTTVVTEQEVVGYETRQTGSQTVVDQPAWDETVTTYTTVTVSNAWDETVTTGYVCSGCGATK